METNKKTVVISLIGGSGVGKSTTAAAVFAEMKNQKMDAELVREYVKEWAWTGKKVGLFGQSIIYGKQLQRESDLYNKVDYIVTDSPLILCPIYQQFYTGQDSIKSLVLNDLNNAKSLGVDHLNFLLPRNKAFVQKGRFETEEQARKVDASVKAFLEYHNVHYVSVNVPDRDRVNFILGYLSALNSV